MRTARLLKAHKVFLQNFVRRVETSSGFLQGLHGKQQARLLNKPKYILILYINLNFEPNNFNLTQNK